jgi:hypothetical protein
MNNFVFNFKIVEKAENIFFIDLFYVFLIFLYSYENNNIWLILCIQFSTWPSDNFFIDV